MFLWQDAYYMKEQDNQLSTEPQTIHGRIRWPNYKLKHFCWEIHAVSYLFVICIFFKD